MAARWFVAASVLCAPLVSALLLEGTGQPLWPTLAALAAGLLARGAAPGSTVPLLVLLAVAPLWQVGVGLATGSSDPQLLMPWLAALAGWLAWPAQSGWRVTGPWRFGIVSWALVAAATWAVTAARELDFTLQTMGVATANGSLGATPERSAAFVALIAEAQLVALLVFDWAWAAPLALRRRAWLALAPALVAACGVAVWQQFVDPAFLSRDPWIRLHRAAGTLYDANAMGALAALVGASLAAPQLSPRRVPRALWCGGWAAIALAGVVATGSRTALAALVGSAAVAAIMGLRGAGRLAAAAAAAALILATLTMGAVAASTDINMGNALGRLAATGQRVLAGGGAGLVDLAWHRDGYGPASMAVIADHPWVGVGPGAFGNLISDYAQEALGYRLPPDNAQNWWRQQLADFGVIGGAGAMSCSVLALLAVLRSWRRPPDAAAISPAPLVALGLMAFVSPPTQHPLLQVLMGLLVAHTVAPAVTAGDPTAPPWRRPVTVALWLVALTCAVGLAVEGWTAFRPPDRASRFHFLYYHGLGAPVETPLGGGRWSARRSVAVFAPEGRTLIVHVVLPHDDLATAPVSVTISDGHRVTCQFEGRDHARLECRMPVPEGRWPLVQIDVSRAWRTVEGVEQAALVAGRFEP